MLGCMSTGDLSEILIRKTDGNCEAKSHLPKYLERFKAAFLVKGKMTRVFKKMTRVLCFFFNNGVLLNFA